MDFDEINYHRCPHCDGNLYKKYIPIKYYNGIRRHKIYWRVCPHCKGKFNVDTLADPYRPYPRFTKFKESLVIGDIAYDDEEANLCSHCNHNVASRDGLCDDCRECYEFNISGDTYEDNNDDWIEYLILSSFS
jgi:RecJ-like exonuclease